MTGNSFGRIFRITTCGESYAGAFRRKDIPEALRGGLMVIVDGVPSGLKLTDEMIHEEMDKRRPGKSALDTPRQERDRAYIFSGVMENDITTGAPVGILIPNSDMLEEQIEKHRAKRYTVRPGQATYTYYEKYGENTDWLGAGRASGRETAARVAGGAVAKVVLDRLGIDVVGFITEIHGVKAGPVTYEAARLNYCKNDLNCPDPDSIAPMIDEILKAKDAEDTVGGVVEIIARGVPPGLGEPVFDKLDALIAHGLMSLGAVKGVEFGEGFGHTGMLGSESNDTPYVEGTTGKIRFKTNHAGGILGGISTGEEIRVRVAVKPTPTISMPQSTVDLKKRENIIAQFTTRNDPTICTRIFAVCEAMVRMVLLDAYYMAKGYEAVARMVREPLP